MSRLAETFARLNAAGEKALACYVMGGDPTPDATAQVIAAVAQGGADVIEVGIPFSDPVADGPVIQAAANRALAAGATPRALLDQVAGARAAGVSAPIALMTYYNIPYAFGVRDFVQAAASAGADATIIADLPPDEGQPWAEASQAAGLDTIFLLAPTSTDHAIHLAARLSTGFIYCVSVLGVTGARDALPTDLSQAVARVKAAASVPVLVGFGISKPEQVRDICRLADGVVVGSALVKLVSAEAPLSDNLASARAFVSSLKQATKTAPSR